MDPEEAGKSRYRAEVILAIEEPVKGSVCGENCLECDSEAKATAFGKPKPPRNRAWFLLVLLLLWPGCSQEPGHRWVEPVSGMEFIHLPAGEFRMGSLHSLKRVARSRKSNTG